MKPACKNIHNKNMHKHAGSMAIQAEFLKLSHKLI